MGVVVERVAHLPDPGLDGLLEEGAAQGFGFVRRLVDDWRSGANRFDGPGEAFFVARRDEGVAGFCGLNVDPYAGNSAVGRLRHLYVAARYRRTGVGRALVARVVAEAARSFVTLTLRTDSPDAAAFYEALGFRRTWKLPSTTHCLDLRGH
jgi:GNAT superfamily N-acetyltransferase